MVGEAPQPYQATIFEELVIEEIPLRKMRGGKPTLEEYLLRFPNRAELVERAWQRALPAGPRSTVDHRADDCGQAMRRQFAEEAKRMLQFDHPHVVKVIALDERTNPPYFVQQYIDGLTLDHRLQAGRRTRSYSLP